jgi:mono/diheme cytochrome c family protein
MSTQNKVLLGIGSIVGVLLLVGWIAINEPARMDVFTQQWQGRSLERGAEIFQSNCTECHGVDGAGLPGAAPALKNPMLFLKANPGKVANDQLTKLTSSQTDLQKSLTDYQANVAKRADLQKQLDATAQGSDERKNLQAQLDSLDAQIKLFDPNTQAKIDALTKQIADVKAQVDQLKAEGWDVTRDVRLTEVSWNGSLEDYLRSTIAGGRPNSGAYWPRPMPTWLQANGGPLRPDQVDNVVAYVMNFQTDAIKLTPNQVKQQFKQPLDPDKAAVANKVFLGTDVDVTKLDLSGGSVDAGKQKYSQFACAACHAVAGGPANPFAPTDGTWTRILNTRMKVPEVAQKYQTPEQYLADSILHPNAYIVPNAPSGVMPQTFGNQLDLQDLKDLIAYLKSMQ